MEGPCGASSTENAPRARRATTLSGVSEYGEPASDHCARWRARPTKRWRGGSLTTQTPRGRRVRQARKDRVCDQSSPATTTRRNVRPGWSSWTWIATKTARRRCAALGCLSRRRISAFASPFARSKPGCWPTQSALRASLALRAADFLPIRERLGDPKATMIRWREPRTAGISGKTWCLGLKAADRSDLLTRPGSSSLPRGIGGRTWRPDGLTA